MDQVPVIDISRVPGDADALRELDDACREWGFFQATGHGIDEDLLAAARAGTKAFFGLPAAQKEAITRTADNVWGFYDRELTKNVRDWKEIFDVGPPESTGPLAGAVPQWPASPPGFEETVRAFSAACERVAHALIRSISINLGEPAASLAAAFAPKHTSFVRLNYYPVCADPASPDSPAAPSFGHLGINRHTDAGALTLVLQEDQAGLQFHRNGSWHLIEPRNDALVVNIGDIVQVWSNDRYMAPLHRVIASGTNERYSAVFFYNPAYDTDYAPLPAVCGEGRPALYRSINWGQFRAGRAAGDYADYGEEIQISHFRVPG